MGKRSNFEKRKNDAYDTPAAAMKTLRPHLVGITEFVEPCAGAGGLIDLLEAEGLRCLAAYDIEPRRWDIEYADARTLRLPRPVPVITNFPWSRHLLHPMIRNLATQTTVWTLLDADWAFCVKGEVPELMDLCHAIVAVGRLKWVPGTKHTAQDNSAWYKFGPGAPPHPLFYRRG